MLRYKNIQGIAAAYDVLCKYKTSTTDSIVRVYKHTMNRNFSINLLIWVSIKYNGQDTNKLCRMTQICGQLLKSFVWTIPINC